MDQYEKQVNENLSALKKPKNVIPLSEQSQKNKENFISNIKKNINNYKIKEKKDKDYLHSKLSTEELLR